MQITTLGEFLSWAEQAFKKAKLYFGHGTNNAWDDAVLIALFVLKLPPDVSKSVLSRVLTAKERQTLIRLANKRIKTRLPVPYLSHEAYFAGLKFYVDQRVIIPRSPIAESLEQQFKPWLGIRKIHRILDLCTGSGCLAIVAAHYFKKAKVDAVDISKKALAVAHKNIQLHKLKHRVNAYYSDLFSHCIEQGKSKTYDLIISNPPYVSIQDFKKLPKEYHHEPKLALVAEKNGLSLVDKILKNASRYLTKQGVLVVEVGGITQRIVEKVYPHLPLYWLSFKRGGEGVFLVYAEDLKGFQ